jgi:hypothetical protein
MSETLTPRCVALLGLMCLAGCSSDPPRQGGDGGAGGGAHSGSSAAGTAGSMSGSGPATAGSVGASSTTGSGVSSSISGAAATASSSASGSASSGASGSASSGGGECSPFGTVSPACADCYASKCGTEVAACFGEDWQALVFSGPCASFASCVVGCDCDTICSQGCGALAQGECLTCFMGMSGCLSACQGECI